MSIEEIYKNLDFLEESIRLQYTNFIYRHLDKVGDDHAAKISLQEIFARLKQDEPIEYIFNLAEFSDLEFYVDNRVLIPRPETEEIVNKTLDFIQSNLREEEFTIVDIGTGSGAIILAIANKLKRGPGLRLSGGTGMTLIGIDISQDAIEVAKINRKKLGLESLVELQTIDFRDFNFSKFKNVIILANLPYIPNSRKLQKSVEKFEPHVALFGGDNGDELINKLKVISKKLKKLRLLITEEDHGEIKVFMA